MKKKLFYLFALICSMSLFIACSDDEKPEVPPTVEDIVAEYSGDDLKLTVSGAETTEGAKIELAKGESTDKVTIILSNIVPGVEEFKIPNATFAAETRSMYISKLSGEMSDDVSGYNVKVEGTVDEKVLTADVTLTEIEGDTVNVSSLYKKVYKGDMNIDVSNIPNPVSMVQRVYIEKPYSYKMEKRDTAMVKLHIKNFAFEDIALGDINVDTIPVVKRGDVYGFEAKGRKIKLQDPIGEVTANLKGAIIGDDMTLALDIDALGMLKVKVAFKGVNVVESQTVSMEEMTITSNVIMGQETASGSLTLKVWGDTPDQDLLLTPKYKISDNGTVGYILLHRDGQEDVYLSQDQVDGKKPIDFSVLKSKDDYIQYHMLAEDPNVSKDYTIYVERWLVNFTFDMKEWVDGNPKGLTSSNGAAELLPWMGINLPAPGAPVTKAEDGSARITTFKTLNKAGANPTLIPAITSGTLFSGDFEIDTKNTLKSTKFGVPYKNAKPVNFKFKYKYTPGETVYQSVEENKKNVAKVVEGKVDECSIAAYLYEVSDYSETLDGTNINTSEKVILRAALADGTAKNDYVEVTVPFEEIGNGSYDASKKYKLAIVCTPSKWGDQFMGADLSSLYVKYLAVE